MSGDPSLVAVFLRWTWWRAVLHRGWWLVTSVYLVVDAGLTPAQLVLIGVAQGLVALGFEIPAGVFADTISRKWSLVVSHLLMGTAMLVTGLVTGFGALLATQMLWGLAWTFASGADVAWITDELADPGRISSVLMRSGRAQLTGAAAGLVGFGALASLTQRSTAMVLAGAAMLLLGLYVGLRFREQRFTPTTTRRWSTSWSILGRGWSLVRGSRPIRLMLAATFLAIGASGAGRLHQRRLIDLGFPAEPLVWFTALGVLTLLAGTAAMWVVERSVGDPHASLRGYAIACAVGTVGLLGLAVAPDPVTGSAAVLLVGGIAMPLTRMIATIWVNQQTTGEVRATVHSFLAQAEYAGAILCGVGIAMVARLADLPATLLTCAGLFAIPIFLINRVWGCRRG
ncbi:MAG: MFS transporter [Sporichthyaceae bacterium]|nr:MFS transporter [Sporichthyaceae bacterium]